MSGFNLQELMSEAKQQYETLQKKMEETVVEGSSGGGSVVVKMDGRKQVLSVKIDPEAVKSGCGNAAGFDSGCPQRGFPPDRFANAVDRRRDAERSRGSRRSRTLSTPPNTDLLSSRASRGPQQARFWLVGVEKRGICSFLQ